MPWPRTAARAGLDVRGVFTFPGHSYAPDKLGQAAVDEARALTEAAESLRVAGIEPSVVSGGSTPSLSSADTDVLTELRPGVYVFGDAQQWELGSMSPDDVALTCRATVVSHAGGRLVLDAGSKALGADRAPYATGYGRLLEHPGRPDRRCSPSTTRSPTSATLPCPRSAAGSTSFPTTCATPSTSPTRCTSRTPASSARGRWSARGQNS